MLKRIVASRHAIWFFALLYFACYVPFTSLTKLLSTGRLPGMDGPIDGAALLPISSLSALVVMLVFVGSTGWWRHAHRVTVAGRRVPTPTRWTALSGLCSSVILTTTTLAYTFEGVSIVFVMLLMRGGVLVLAPVVDAMTGRSTRWFSWAGLGLSMAALVVAFSEDGAFALSAFAALDIALYLSAYLVRLRFMSKLAKSDEPDIMKRYFVEEQLITAPATLVLLAVGGAVGAGPFLGALREGWTVLWGSGHAVAVASVGVLSQLVGIFGTLVFLDRRENTFSVPVNRSSSLLAGVVASFGLAALYCFDPPSAHQLVGGGLVIGAILVLSLAPMLGKPASD